jgi:hypothetical protein
LNEVLAHILLCFYQHERHPSYSNNETDSLLGSILSAGGGGGGGGGSNVAERDRVLGELAVDIQARVAQAFDERAIAKKYPVMCVAPPTIFYQQPTQL